VPQVKSPNRLWIGRLQAAFVGLIVGSITVLLIRLWGQIRRIPWRFNGLHLSLSVVLLVTGIVSWAIVWSWMLQQLGKRRLPLRETASVYIYGNAAKYVPGAIWNYFARVYLGQRQGMEVRQMWIANLIEILVSLCTGLILYGGSLLWPHIHRSLLPKQLIVTLITALLAVVSPPALRVLDSLVRRLQRQGGSQHQPILLSWGSFARYILFSCITWLLIGLAFYFLVQSVYPLPLNYLPEAIGVWSLSVVVGLAAVGIPQGLGVKEGILVMAMNAIVPLPVALSISVLSRVWLIACDLVATLAWWLIETALAKCNGHVKLT
jgi:uncharacterized membrane protein YbhN (UPF0104 family)